MPGSTALQIVHTIWQKPPLYLGILTSNHMLNLNRIQLIGHLGADPEVKTLPSGHQVATLKLATSEAYKDANDKWQQQTQWHTLILWNKQAAFAALHFRKGEKLYAEGKLTYREYISPNQGKKRVSEIVIEKIFSLEKKTYTNPNMEAIEPDSNALPW